MLLTYVTSSWYVNSVLFESTNLKLMEVITMLLVGGASYTLHDLITTSLQPDDRPGERETKRDEVS